MKIFRFDYDNHTSEWIYSPNLEEAKEWYASHMGENLDVFDDYDDIQEVPRDKWKDCNLIDPEDSVDFEDEDEIPDGYDDSGYKILGTFESYARENTRTDMICTTEF